MTSKISIAAPNSLILVMDHSAGVLPDYIGDNLVAATDSCVAVGTSSKGETSVSLSSRKDDGFAGKLVYSGMIHVPTKQLSVCNVLNEKLLTVEIESDEVALEVYADDDIEPDKIEIVYKRPRSIQH